MGPQGEIDYELLGPQVAAVRVPGLGTVRSIVLPGLPPGDRVAVFYRPPGSIGSVIPAGLPSALGPGNRPVIVTQLDNAGHPLPTTAHFGVSVLANRYWQRPDSEPSDGRCALSSHIAGARVQWGQVATTLAGAPAAATSAFLACLQVWYSTPTGSFQAAMLLDARAPGSTPAPLWGATPVPDHPWDRANRAANLDRQSRPRAHAPGGASTDRTHPVAHRRPPGRRHVNRRATRRDPGQRDPRPQHACHHPSAHPLTTCRRLSTRRRSRTGPRAPSRCHVGRGAVAPRRPARCSASPLSRTDAGDRHGHMPFVRPP